MVSAAILPACVNAVAALSDDRDTSRDGIIPAERQIGAGGQHIVAPFKSLMTRHRVGKRGRAVSVTNGRADRRWPLLRLELPPTPEGQT